MPSAFADASLSSPANARLSCPETRIPRPSAWKYHAAATVEPLASDGLRVRGPTGAPLPNWLLHRLFRVYLSVGTLATAGCPAVPPLRLQPYLQSPKKAKPSTVQSLSPCCSMLTLRMLHMRGLPCSGLVLGAHMHVGAVASLCPATLAPHTHPTILPLPPPARSQPAQAAFLRPLSCLQRPTAKPHPRTERAPRSRKEKNQSRTTPTSRGMGVTAPRSGDGGAAFLLKAAPAVAA